MMMQVDPRRTTPPIPQTLNTKALNPFPKGLDKKIPIIHNILIIKVNKGRQGLTNHGSAVGIFQEP